MIGALDGQRYTLETITIKYQMDQCIISNRFWIGIKTFEALKDLTIQYWWVFSLVDIFFLTNVTFQSQLNEKTAKHIAEAIPKLKSLETIDLEGNPIDAKGAYYLLGDSKKLKRWGFRWVNISQFLHS